VTQDELERLESDLRALHNKWGPAVARAAFEEQAAALDPQSRAWLEARVFHAAGDVVAGDKVGSDKVGRDKVVAPQGTVTVDGTLHGMAVGVNQGTMQQFFGTTSPGEDKATLLADYLVSLTSECQQLRLHRLVEQRQTGSEQQAVPQLKLQAVYTGLRTNDGRLATENVRQADEQQFDLRLQLLPLEGKSTRLRTSLHCLTLLLTLRRVIETIYQANRLVLLGEPGSGKKYGVTLPGVAAGIPHSGSDHQPANWVGRHVPIRSSRLG
jgi:hypothetical protein